MSGETEALAQFASSLKYEDIPERVREHTKNVLLDTLACAVAGPGCRRCTTAQRCNAAC